MVSSDGWTKMSEFVLPKGIFRGSSDNFFLLLKVSARMVTRFHTAENAFSVAILKSFYVDTQLLMGPMSTKQWDSSQEIALEAGGQDF